MRRSRLALELGVLVLMASVIGVAIGAEEAHTYKAASYKPGGDTGIDLQGTALMPKAKGHAKISNKRGSVWIKASFWGLESPSSFGPEYTTYVVWAVSPEGAASNVGEISPKGYSAAFRAATRFQSFGLFVTAEPHFAVRQPSTTLLMENVFPEDSRFTVEPIHPSSALLSRIDYKPAALKQASIDKNVPHAVYQARNALHIAKWKKADTYAPEAFATAQSNLKAAEAALSGGESLKKVREAARTAAQTAEDAKVISVQKAAEEALEAERRSAAEKQLTLEREKAQAEVARARAEAEKASAQAVAKRESAAAQWMRTRLIEQLNYVLETKESPRGLVVSMAGVLFDTGKANLKAEAREKLAKVSGLVMAASSLRLEIEGHTDSTGSEETNRTLSLKRAESVRDYLGSMGVPASAMSSAGLSSTMPVADDTTADGRQKNRRVEIIISGAAIGT